MTTTATTTDLPEPPLDADLDSLSLGDLLRYIEEECTDRPEKARAALHRRRHLILTNDKDDLQLLEYGCLHSEHAMLLFLLEKEKEKEGRLFITPNLKLLERLDRHALFTGHRQPQSTTTTLDRVKELLPNLTVFQLMQQHGSPQELVKVAQLLSHYRTQLEVVTVVFWGERRGNQSQKEVQRSFQQAFTLLMISLNRLTKLRRLEVDFNAAPGCPVVIADDDDGQLVPLSLPDLVGRLETLKFRTCLQFNGESSEKSSHLLDARLLKQVLRGMSSKLKQQQPPPKKEQENLELFVSSTPLTLETLISLGPVAAGLRSVEIDGRFSVDLSAEYGALAQFARQSPHLQEITVSLNSLSILRLVESLSTLQELVHLIIRCGDAVSPPPQKEETETEVNVGPLPVLLSLKSLRLEFPARSHRNYEQLHLETLFPNLQNILWIHIGWGCTDCRYEVSKEVLAQVNVAQFKAAYGKPMSECLRQARLAAFSRLPLLANLWLKVRPHCAELPFKDQMFTSRKSLRQRTKFIDLTDEEVDQDSSIE